MAEIRTVAISELSSSFSTRRRGAEAYERLLPLLQDGPIILDLDGIDVMPASFLDALIIRLIDSGHAASVAFKTTNLRAEDKLRRLSGLRDVDIFVYRQSGDQEKLERRPLGTLKVHHTDNEH